jgi:hypothetical protein
VTSPGICGRSARRRQVGVRVTAGMREDRVG